MKKLIVILISVFLANTSAYALVCEGQFANSKINFHYLFVYPVQVDGGLLSVNHAEPIVLKCQRNYQLMNCDSKQDTPTIHYKLEGNYIENKFLLLKYDNYDTGDFVQNIILKCTQ